MPNLLLLAADRPDSVLEFLKSQPDLAKVQDEHGYSLIHAAASYNHLDFLRKLVNDYKVDVNTRDEDNESALFVVETIEAAKTLVELGADTKLVGDEGETARQRIEKEADFPEVAQYLLSIEDPTAAVGNTDVAPSPPIFGQAPPVPQGINVNIGTMGPDEIGDNPVNDEFRMAIEQLAQRPDFQGEEGQAELRRLITEALQGHVEEDGSERVRQRTE